MDLNLARLMSLQGISWVGTDITSSSESKSKFTKEPEMVFAIDDIDEPSWTAFIDMVAARNAEMQRN
jgi:hypothetical protein